MSKSARLSWSLLGLSAGFACIIGLIQANGSIARGSAAVLCVLGTTFIFVGAVGLNWHKAPHRIGTLPRTLIIFIASGGIMGIVCWYVWPVPPAPHIHVASIGFSIPDAAMGHAEAKIVFANNGEAPAKLRSGGRMAWYIDQGTMRQRWDFEDSLFRGEPIVGSDALTMEIPFGTDRSITLSSSPWMDGAVKAFQDGKGTVYAAGTIFYAVGNGVCQTRYCMYVGRDGNGKFCLKYNEEPRCAERF